MDVAAEPSHCAPAPLEQAGVGIPDMWHVAIHWSLGTDENVTGLAGIPGTTYGRRGDKSLRTGAWLRENPLFITAKAAQSVLGPCRAAGLGGKGCAAAEDLETPGKSSPQATGSGKASAGIDLGETHGIFI